MSKAQILQWTVLCWVVITLFVGLTVWFGWGVHVMPGGAPGHPAGLMCGNSVTDPLEFILNIGAPLGFTALFRLAFLFWKKLVPLWAVITAAILTFACTAWLISFGVNFFRMLPGFHLSDIVWWLRPFGKLLGI